MKNCTRSARFLALLATGVLTCTGSCRKENSQASQTLPGTAVSLAVQADAEASGVFNDVFDNVMGVNNQVGMAGTGIFARTIAREDSLGTCYTVQVTSLAAPALFPVQVTIDFGPGCQGKDGHVRRGRILVTYSGRLIKPGAGATVRLDGFALDSLEVDGTLSITNTGSPAGLQFSVDVPQASLRRPSGDYTQWTSHRVLTQSQGMATPDFPLDDTYRIEGGSRGLVQQDSILANWETTITDPLIKRFLCRWIVQGKIQVVLSGSTPDSWSAVLDYGRGACDNYATVTVNGTVREISLH
ncbi:MAG TPA: hypothetical protein VG870_13105 [Chitinophagaceae bacterium]|nr:hypothetical protein [Chitinophagaceae bacterium]